MAANEDYSVEFWVKHYDDLDDKNNQYWFNQGNAFAWKAYRDNIGFGTADYFQLVNQIEPECCFIDKTMWDMERTDDIIVIHITSTPRTSEMKQAFFKELPIALENAIGLKPDNVFISIV